MLKPPAFRFAQCLIFQYLYRAWSLAYRIKVYPSPLPIDERPPCQNIRPVTHHPSPITHHPSPITHHPAHRSTHYHPKPHREVPAYVKAFIDAHLAAAQAIQRKYGVPVGLVLAQSALESGWGRRAVSNAYFGVKGHAPSGRSTTFTTHENVDGRSISQRDAFRAYSGYDDAAEDDARMLKNNPHFRSCFLYTRSSQFAAVVARAHYGTDPYYGTKLTGIIREFNLESPRHFRRPFSVSQPKMACSESCR
jgi:flagellar protein FlgJ